MLNLLKIIYEQIWCIFAVNYWVQLYDDYPYSKSFDKWMRQSLKDGHQLIPIDGFNAMFNGRKIWIESFPHAAFHLKEYNIPKVSPSRYTKYLLGKQLKIIKKQQKKQQAIRNETGWKK